MNSKTFLAGWILALRHMDDPQLTRLDKILDVFPLSRDWRGDTTHG